MPGPYDLTVEPHRLVNVIITRSEMHEWLRTRRSAGTCEQWL